MAEIEVYKRRIEDLNKIIKEGEEWKAKYYQLEMSSAEWRNREI